MTNFKFLKSNDFSRLPKTAGVYAFRSEKELLYIGKAVNIKERVKNHFQQPSYRDNLFIDKVKKIGYIKTGSEIEALILEANLIKKRQPNYNIIWKDDKNYFYIAITNEEYPRVFITHQIKDSSNKQIISFVGPFVDGSALKQSLKTLRKVFPYRTCRNLPKKSCLWYHLDRCTAPCLLNAQVFQDINQSQNKRNKTSINLKKEYQKNIKNLVSVFKAKKIQVLKEMKKEMKTLAKEEKFEDADKIKIQIQALEKIFKHTFIFSQNEIELNSTKEWPYLRAEAYDISNIQGKMATGSMIVFSNGKADKSQYRKFKIKMQAKPNDVAMIQEILLRRLNHPEWPYPNLILIDGGKAQLNVALSIIRKQKSIFRNLKIMSLAKKNNELFIEGQNKPVLLKNSPKEFSNIILQLRDEAHRFAIGYHKKLRKKQLLK